MPLVITPDSALGRELDKWDTPRREGGMHVDGYEPYPKMLYQARQLPNGKVVCFEESDPRQGTKVVHSEAEERIALGQGWCHSPQEALDAFEAEQIAIGDASAEAAAAVRTMTPKAQRERAAREAKTARHVTD